MSENDLREVGTPVPFTIEEGAVRQFARATQLAGAAAIEPGSPAPVTFLMAVAHWMPPEAKVVTGFERSRLLHGGQEFLLPDGPPPVGARLTARERIVDRYEKAGRKGGLMRFAVVVTEFTDETTGRLVAEMRSTLIEREGSVA